MMKTKATQSPEKSGGKIILIHKSQLVEHAHRGRNNETF